MPFACSPDVGSTLACSAAFTPMAQTTVQKVGSMMRLGQCPLGTAGVGTALQNHRTTERPRLEGTQPGSVLSAPSLQVLINIDEIPREPPLLRAPQEALPNPRCRGSGARRPPYCHHCSKELGGRHELRFTGTASVSMP